MIGWWEPSTDIAYKEKAQCIVDQYSKFVHPQVGLNLNGAATQGENIADNGGVKMAYKAYGNAFNQFKSITLCTVCPIQFQLSGPQTKTSENLSFLACR